MNWPTLFFKEHFTDFPKLIKNEKTFPEEIVHLESKRILLTPSIVFRNRQQSNHHGVRPLYRDPCPPLYLAPMAPAHCSENMESLGKGKRALIFGYNYTLWLSRLRQIRKLVRGQELLGQGMVPPMVYPRVTLQRRWMAAPVLLHPRPNLVKNWRKRNNLRHLRIEKS